MPMVDPSSYYVRPEEIRNLKNSGAPEFPWVGCKSNVSSPCRVAGRSEQLREGEVSFLLLCGYPNTRRVSN